MLIVEKCKVYSNEVHIHFLFWTRHCPWRSFMEGTYF
jgi:hypothetical protein